MAFATSDSGRSTGDGGISATTAAASVLSSGCGEVEGVRERSGVGSGECTSHAPAEVTPTRTSRMASGFGKLPCLSWRELIDSPVNERYGRGAFEPFGAARTFYCRR